MKLKFAQHLIIMMFIIVIVPVSMMADDSHLKLSVHDISVLKGERAELKVDIRGGKAPYSLTWFDSNNEVVNQNIKVLVQGTSVTAIYAFSTEDFFVKVEDAEGTVAADVLRLVVKDFKTLPACFENLDVYNFYSKQEYLNRNTISDKGWDKSFVNGSFVFSPIPDSKPTQHKTGFYPSTSSSLDVSKDILDDDVSVTGSGFEGSFNYTVVSDSAYITFADKSIEFKPVSGFYITNSSATQKYITQGKKSFRKGESAYVTVTNLANGKSLDFYLADYSSKNKDERYCLDTWQWVDIRPLHYTHGTLKLKLNFNRRSKSDEKHKSRPTTFCVDNFNSNCLTTDVSTQMVGVDSVINLDQIVFLPDNGVENKYSIYNIEGGFTDASHFQLIDNKLKISAPYCNARITLRVFNKGKSRYVTVPVVVDSDHAEADFENMLTSEVNDTCSLSVLRSGTYVFAPDNDVRSKFYTSFNNNSDSITSDSVTWFVQDLVSKKSTAFATMANSGYIYSMCHDDEISGFYVRPSEKTYTSITEGEGLHGKPFNLGDSLMLTVEDPVTHNKIQVVLADYRSKEKTEHFCLDSWKWIDLTALGKVNSLHLSLSGSRFSENQNVPEICIDNLGGSPIVTTLPPLEIVPDSVGRSSVSLDSYIFSRDFPAGYYSYELESVNGVDNSDCVNITADTLYCVASHNQRFDVIAKVSDKHNTKYVSIPLTVNAYKDNKETSDGSCVTPDVNEERESIPEENDSNLDNHNRKNSLPVVSKQESLSDDASVNKKTKNSDDDGCPLKPLDVHDTDNTLNSHDTVPAKIDTTSLIQEKVKDGNEDGTVNKESAHKDNKNTANIEESTDMRIVYIMLFLFVLLLVIMYIYMKRHSESGAKELESLKKRYAESIAMYDRAKDEIASLSALKQKYSEALSDYQRAQAEIQTLSELKQKYSETAAKCDELQKRIDSLDALNKEYLSTIEGLKNSLPDADYVDQLKLQYSEALAEKEKAQKESDAIKVDLNKKIEDKDSEIARLKNALSSYQDNVNPDEWNAEQSLLEHETVVQLHHVVDGAHMASESQWADLNGVVSKLLPGFYSALSSKSSNLSDNEFKVCLLTRLKFLPTEMAVLLNLSKQRITNIRAAVNKKLFNESGTKTFENNMFNLGI